jgi:pimeloyl-ACP methyl ester carboxylesterase
MQQMAQQIPRSRYVEMTGVGHLMNLEAPHAFDTLLLDFLREPAPKHRPDLH